MVEIPRLAELPAAPRRIILHWTGGPHRANSVDRKAYHYVVEHDGNVVQGVHPVAHNMRTLTDDHYAHHTGGFNSFSVGVSFAGMMDSVSAARPGPAPLKPGQVMAGLRFVAECCDAWSLDPRDPDKVFHHREAWELHRVKGKVNHQKMDITFLPFMPELGFSDTGPWLRGKIAEMMDGGRPVQPVEPGTDPLPVPVPVPGERRWSRVLGWIRLSRYVSEDEWYCQAETPPDSPIIRAGARWSEMARNPPE
jgi:hypothetical protein